MPPTPSLSWQRLQEIRTKADRFWYGMNSKLILELLSHIQVLDLALQKLGKLGDLRDPQADTSDSDPLT